MIGGAGGAALGGGSVELPDGRGEASRSSPTGTHWRGSWTLAVPRG